MTKLGTESLQSFHNLFTLRNRVLNHFLFILTSLFFNGMTLSTLSINSHDFAFCFPKWSHTNGDVFITYKPMIIPLISQCGIFSEHFCPKKKYTIEPPLTMNPSNNLLLIETRLLLWNPRTKYTLCSTLESLLTTPLRLTTSLFDI